MAGATVATWVKVRTKSGLTARPISHKYEGGANYEKGQVITQSEYEAIKANRKESEKSGKSNNAPSGGGTITASAVSSNLPLRQSVQGSGNRAERRMGGNPMGGGFTKFESKQGGSLKDGLSRLSIVEKRAKAQKKAAETRAANKAKQAKADAARSSGVKFDVPSSRR